MRVLPSAWRTDEEKRRGFDAVQERETALISDKDMEVVYTDETKQSKVQTKLIEESNPINKKTELI